MDKIMWKILIHRKIQKNIGKTMPYSSCTSREWISMLSLNLRTMLEPRKHCWCGSWEVTGRQRTPIWTTTQDPTRWIHGGLTLMTSQWSQSLPNLAGRRRNKRTETHRQHAKHKDITRSTTPKELRLDNSPPHPTHTHPSALPSRSPKPSVGPRSPPPLTVERQAKEIVPLNLRPRLRRHEEADTI
jgi:hypothetical protein